MKSARIILMSEVSALPSGRNGEVLSREVVKVKNHTFLMIFLKALLYKDKLFFSHNEQNPYN